MADDFIKFKVQLDLRLADVLNRKRPDITDLAEFVMTWSCAERAFMARQGWSPEQRGDLQHEARILIDLLRSRIPISQAMREYMTIIFHLTLGDDSRTCTEKALDQAREETHAFLFGRRLKMKEGARTLREAEELLAKEYGCARDALYKRFQRNVRLLRQKK
jgi:hypothetical protein